MERLEQVLRFKINALSYCINSEDIVQIIRVPSVTRVPLLPYGVRGIASIEGNIVAVLDSKQLILHSDEETDATKEKSRLLTVRTRKGVLGFLVDEVIENHYVDENNIEYTDDGIDIVIAVMKADEEILQVVSMERIIKDIQLPSYPKEPIKENASTVTPEALHNDSVLKLLFFTMADEIFAVDIELIREIINADISFTTIADVPKYTLGMFTLRDKIVVAHDLRNIFGLAGKDSEQNRIVIINTGARALGLLVDGIMDIKDILVSSIELFPEGQSDNKLLGVTKFDKRLVSIIDKKFIDKLAFETKSVESGSQNSQAAAITQGAIPLKGDEMELVIFKLGREEYAFDIEDVEEIIRYGDITPIADAAKYVKGIINLRGSVIPIFSLHERLGFEERIDDDTKILVCKVKGSKIGFLVDNLSEVLNVPQSSINDCVQSDSVFSNVIVLNGGKRMIMRLSIGNIFDKDQNLDFVKQN